MKGFKKAINLARSLINQKTELTLRDTIVTSVFKNIDEYADWYAEAGLLLPPDFATDPTQWTEALRKMQRAFSLVSEEIDGYGELWEAKNKWKEFNEKDAEEIKLLEQEINEGFALFGKYLYYMNDFVGVRRTNKK